MERSGRYGPLDGVRGIAILLVLLNHFMPDVLMPDRFQEWTKKLFTTGGWVGVDLFFVLSGFLITGILLRTKSDPNYFLNFYVRRILRIFPLYYASLAIIFIAIPIFRLVPEAQFEPIREWQAFHWLYGTNFAFWLLPKDSLSSNQIELRHLWSLAVEEHFYLIWPALVWMLSVRQLKFVCVGLIVSALTLRILGAHFEASPGYFTLTYCRWDALASGALIALVVNDDASSIRRIRACAIAMVLLGAFLLGVCFILNKGLWSTAPVVVTAGVSIIAATFAGLIILVIDPSTSVARTCDVAPLRFFGNYSYGLYVIHGSIVPLLSAMLPTEAWIAAFNGSILLAAFLLAATKITICTGLAVASYHLYEVRFLRLKQFFESRPRQMPLDGSGTEVKHLSRQLGIRQNPTVISQTGKDRESGINGRPAGSSEYGQGPSCD